MNEPKKCCGTCDWHEDFTGACFNGDSRYCCDFTSADDYCPCWELRKEAQP